MPDSSPTATICDTIEGKTFAFASGTENERPCRTDSWTSCTARSTAQLFDACPTIASAWMIGTPASSIIERLRLKRATAIFVKILPKIGILSLIGSTTLRTLSLFLLRSHQIVSADDRRR